jgi:N-ethylmaleimide reductase
MARLQDTLKVGALELENRVLMAPLTRCRAGAGDVPVPINAEYYAQRASAGLIVTEATNVSPNSCAFENAPGIWTQAQVEGWKIVTRAVHEKGGRIFMQLWHCGRVGSEWLFAAPISLTSDQ